MLFRLYFFTYVPISHSNCKYLLGLAFSLKAHCCIIALLWALTSLPSGPKCHTAICQDVWCVMSEQKNMQCSCTKPWMEWKQMMPNFLYSKDVSSCSPHAAAFEHANKCLGMLLQWHCHLPIQQPTVIVTVQWCCPCRFQHVIFAYTTFLTAQGNFRGQKKIFLVWHACQEQHFCTSSYPPVQNFISSFCVCRSFWIGCSFVCFIFLSWVCCSKWHCCIGWKLESHGTRWK